MIRAALLDVDGTLLASNDAQARSWSDALVESGHEADFTALRRSIGLGGDRLLRSVAGLDEREEPGRTISRRRREILLDRYARGLLPTPGARDLVDWLRQCGTRIVIATGASSEEIDTLLRAAGVDDLVDVTVTADDAARTKPAPDIVLAALERAGVPASDAVMIGDTPYDVVAARAASVQAIAVRCGGWSSADLAGASVFADPQDLLERYRESPLRTLEHAR
ncbi:MAG: HAD family hydrolase [Vulcanimicrobiaceae bacterium]